MKQEVSNEQTIQKSAICSLCKSSRLRQCYAKSECDCADMNDEILFDPFEDLYTESLEDYLERVCYAGV